MLYTILSTFRFLVNFRKPFTIITRINLDYINSKREKYTATNGPLISCLKLSVNIGAIFISSCAHLKISASDAVHPAIGDAIDEDASGYVSVYEANRFFRRKPENWDTPEWIALQVFRNFSQPLIILIP